MRRREFILLLGAASLWTLLARAQKPCQIRRIGALMGVNESDHEAQSGVAAFREELQKLGWTEGRNIEIDTRWAKADLELMKLFANDLVVLQPDLILTVSTAATGVTLQRTHTIPIIFILVADPVGSRFVATLAQPGGNATGFTLSSARWVANGSSC